MNATITLEASSEAAQRLFDEILRSANYFLHNCKHFSMAVLQEEDPSYGQIAELTRKLAAIIRIVADEFDPMMGQKADEYCELMTRMSVAIENGDEIALKPLVAELDRKPGI